MIALSKLRIRIDVFLQKYTVFFNPLLKLLSFGRLLGRVEEYVNETLFFVTFKKLCLDGLSIHLV